MYLITRPVSSSQLLQKEEKGVIDLDPDKRKEINFFKGKYLGVFDVCTVF